MGRTVAINWCGTHAGAKAQGTQIPCVVATPATATANKVNATPS